MQGKSEADRPTSLSLKDYAISLGKGHTGEELHELGWYGHACIVDTGMPRDTLNVLEAGVLTIWWLVSYT